MQVAVRIGASCVTASVVLLAASQPAAAAPKLITGKLTRAGYTVIALAEDGRAKSVRPRGRSFKLRPPADLVTLHLRAPSGVYAGPIVVGRERKGRRAILGVTAGARLGRLKVGVGYAKVSGRLRKKWIDTRRQARAKKGVPIGAGVFGRVRSRPSRGSVPGDMDLDGIPSPLDIDDDGDLILDDFDRRTGAQAAQVAQQFSVQSDLVLGFEDSMNVNGGSTPEQIERTLASQTPSGAFGGRLEIQPLPGDSPAELDCGGLANPRPPPPWLDGLAYCTRGGTGRAFQAGFKFSESPRFPDDFDPDGDGYGTLGTDSGFTFSHGANSSQIRTGDLLIQRVIAGGREILYTATVQYIFVTGPALRSYHDTARNSATLSYPRPGYSTLRVEPGADGNIVVTLTFWRPQRRRIAADPAPGPEESAEWTDIGGLRYRSGISFVQGGPDPGGRSCPKVAYTEDDPTTPGVEDDPNLTPAAGGGFVDLSRDRPASVANTLTFTLDATRCLTALGVPAWDADQTVSFNFIAATEQDSGTTGQGGVPFRRQ